MATQICFMFIPKLGEDGTQFDDHIFQRGYWNHQLVKVYPTDGRYHLPYDLRTKPQQERVMQDSKPTKCIEYDGSGSFSWCGAHDKTKIRSNNWKVTCKDLTPLLSWISGPARQRTTILQICSQNLFYTDFPLGSGVFIFFFTRLSEKCDIMMIWQILTALGYK